MIGAALACVAMGAVAWGDDARKVAGRVVDGEGKPVAGADVATFWQAHDGRLRPLQAATTGDDGRFELKVQTYGRDQGLLAFDRDRKRGGTAIIKAKGGDEPAEIRLGPLVRVHGQFSSKELGERPDWTNVYMSLRPGGLRVAACDSKEASFSLELPPGEYDFYGYGSFTDYEGVNKPVTLEAGRADLDLGTFDLKATPIARHYGKEPPAWNVTEARGADGGKDVTLADFRGKWVLIEFWGFW
jgi:hypothetical protein